MIRHLSPDELVWFVSRAAAFQGHSDPLGFAQRLAPSLKDVRRDAERCFVHFDEGRPEAGAYARAHAPEEDDQSLTLTQLWFDDDGAALSALVEELFRLHPHESVYAPLVGIPQAPAERLTRALEPLGFASDAFLDLRFPLSEVPPIGLPLVLEAWSLSADDAFRELFERAEAGERSDNAWAWLKRWRGPFRPDLWFLARETLDQEPVGYAFVGSVGTGLDARYYLTAVGVLPEHRHSSEMLRRLVVTTLTELAARSPLGAIDTTLTTRDPKLIDIFRSLGFESGDPYPMLVKLPA